MARENTLVCPSGLTVRFRSIKGKDLDSLRDRKRMATGESIVALLDACTLEITDRGIYGNSPNFRWIDTLVGDQMTAFVGLRRATAGDEFDFRIRCQDRQCRNMISWQLDLNELTVKQLSDTSRETYLSGNRFTATVADTKVEFSLQTGADAISKAKRIAKLQADIKRENKGQSENQTKALLGLVLRIRNIEGVAPEDKLDWLDELDLSDIRSLQEQMDEVDCGVDTTVEVICTGEDSCGLTQEVELPLDNTFFREMVS